MPDIFGLPYYQLNILNLTALSTYDRGLSKQFTYLIGPLLDHASSLFFYGRGVRSDVQLSCTETQFQKCSQSGKNGSKHPMLSISNGLQCDFMQTNRKKHSKNQDR